MACIRACLKVCAQPHTFTNVCKSAVVLTVHFGRRLVRRCLIRLSVPPVAALRLALSCVLDRRLSCDHVRKSTIVSQLNASAGGIPCVRVCTSRHNDKGEAT